MPVDAPTLITPRLRLRPPRVEDFPDYARLMASDRAVHMGGPFAIPMAWGLFCHDIAQWALFGLGALSIDLPDGTTVGQVGLNRGPLFPEPELGWLVYAGHEGRGYAFEAATALRDWAFLTRGLPTLVS
ncbi:GNAT family N-acetyltransferase [Frigidibacter oleivorans]|uniref:GNAT family N-acetyltransferase n=1 Tax=Frigidibacter oleivorans TaxID=2487129 RepID=UPI002E252607